MRQPFLDYLGENVVVCDGAMGTQLYARGVFLNRCFDELNLTQPALVRDVHQEYVWAGAEIIETNTFGANRVKLESHGLSDRVREINHAGVKLAREVARDAVYVAGSVGPLGIRVEPYGKMRADEARAVFVEQVEALVEAGADLISLETFSDLNEIREALAAVRAACALPVMAQITLEENGNSRDGTPAEAFARQLEQWGADIIGVNCGVGPQSMLESIERMSDVVTRSLVAQPNAGKPRNFEGRNLYLSSPEYLANYARRFIRAGVQIVGGCCGTTPAHVKAMREKVRALRAAPHGVRMAVNVETPAPRVEVIPAPKRSRFAHCLAQGAFVTAVDVVPPTGVDASEVTRWARGLKDSGIDAIRVVEAPRSSASMASLALAVLLERESGADPILHFTCADRSLLSMQSDLLGAYALGLRNILLATGEPIRVGDYADATAVRDADSIGVTRLVAALNHGRDLGGKPIGRPTGFFVGVTINPAALDLEDEVRRLERKVEAGADFAVTMPLFRPEMLEQFLARSGQCRIPVLASIRPLAGYREAEFLNNEVPGISISEPVMRRLSAAEERDAARAEGIAVAREILDAVRPMVQGIVLTVPLASAREALEILAG